MAATPSVRIVKHAAYRGGTRTFGNRYHFAGGTPADLTHWTTLVNNIVTAEKLAASDVTVFDEAICYDAGTDVPLHTISLSGTGSSSGGAGATQPPLEVCALIRWSTDQRTVKNHPIYLFTYFRRIHVQSGGDYELLDSTQKTAITTYANAWVSGFSDGAVTHPRAGPNGAVGLGALVETYVTHRDFPR